MTQAERLAAHVRSGMPWSSRVASSSWHVPDEIELGGDATLRWRGGISGSPTLLSVPSDTLQWDDLIFRFMHLADADDCDVLEFARQLGVLDLCGHGLPRTHVTGVGNGGWRPQFCPYGVEPDGDGWRAEGLDRWRLYARQAGAILSVAAAFHTDSHVPEGVWDSFEDLEPRWIGVPWSRPDPPRMVARSEEELRGLGRGLIGDIQVILPRLMADRSDADRLEWALTQWLALGDVRLWLTHDELDFWVRFGGGTLFGALATELALMVSRMESLFPCSGCAEPFVDESGRRSASDAHWWCPKPACKRKRAAHAARASRARKRETERA